jgi:hypothetical protein
MIHQLIIWQCWFTNICTPSIRTPSNEVLSKL